MTESTTKQKTEKTEQAARPTGTSNVSRKEGDSGEKNVQDRRGRKPVRREARKPRAEFAQKIISIRRVTRVMAGGRRFSFSVSVVIGDKKGSVGVGMGKAGDTALAIEKAYNDAKNSMITVPLTEEMTIPHEVRGKFTSSEIFIKPAPGKGVIAGSSVRTVLELAGVTDVNAKIFSRSKNPFNNAKVAIQVLGQLEGKASQRSGE